MTTIRPEAPDDAGSIREVLLAAFPSDVEARLVESLRENGKIVVGLVAELGGRIAGHIAFSPVSMDPPLATLRGIGLAPVAASPDVQGKGIGSQLIRDGLSRCAALGYDFVVVLGEPAYYRRFGFSSASARGLRNVYAVDEPFMVLELSEGCLAGCNALIRYAPEFNACDP
jgi:putative acetyltransferase